MVADVLLTALGHAWRTLEGARMTTAVMGGIALPGPMHFPWATACGTLGETLFLTRNCLCSA